jgi:hypothetical protein
MEHIYFSLFSLSQSKHTSTIFLKDRLGLSNTNNITVTTVGGAVLLDGATTFVINLAYGSNQFIFNGTSYEVF